MHNVAINPKNEPFTRTVDTQKLVTFLRDTNVGDVITYAALEKHMRFPCQSGCVGYSVLSSARRILEQEEGIIFDTKTGEGLVRLSDSGKLKLVANTLQLTHKRVKKAMKRASTIDPEKLEGEDKHRYATNVSLLGVIELATRAKTAKQLEGGMTKPAVLAVNETLAFLKA